MKDWRRLETTAYCGRCGNEIPAGEALLALHLEKVTRLIIRCANCEGPAPPDLPALIVRSPTTKKMQPLARTAKAVADKWKPYKDAE